MTYIIGLEKKTEIDVLPLILEIIKTDQKMKYLIPDPLYSHFETKEQQKSFNKRVVFRKSIYQKFTFNIIFIIVPS